ncbi:hypothetical protein AB0E62_28240 [Streptomyces sp. NPDC038707]|uniref:hypothetical protein n=1 Tax=Streptomyces sp. NPDC038707 TaxID=3154329 RepID=UPI0033F4E5BE
MSGQHLGGLRVLGAAPDHVGSAGASETALPLAATGDLATPARATDRHPLSRRKTRRDGQARPAPGLPDLPRTGRGAPAFPACVTVPLYADGGAGRTTVLRPPPLVATPGAGRHTVRARVTRTSTGAGA